MSDADETNCVLHSFDTELVKRISEELERQGIAFNRLPITDESGLEAWELSVLVSHRENTVRLIAEIENTYRIDSSNIQCHNCGSGMLPKEYAEPDDEPEGIVIYFCPACKVEHIT